jgi:hypothetical protein
VQPADKQPAARQPESGLEAALRKGAAGFQQAGELRPPCPSSFLRMLFRCLQPPENALSLACHASSCLPRSSDAAAPVFVAGLERFRFDDATGGDDGGNTTGGFGDT